MPFTRVLEPSFLAFRDLGLAGGPLASEGEEDGMGREGGLLALTTKQKCSEETRLPEVKQESSLRVGRRNSDTDAPENLLFFLSPHSRL